MQSWGYNHVSKLLRSVWLFVCLVFALALSTHSSIVRAQRGDGPPVVNESGPFGALQWRNLGPLRGGRSTAVAGSAARPFEYYFGATGGGLWKTVDGGTTWRPVIRKVWLPLRAPRNRWKSPQ